MFGSWQAHSDRLYVSYPALNSISFVSDKIHVFRLYWNLQNVILENLLSSSSRRPTPPLLSLSLPVSICHAYSAWCGREGEWESGWGAMSVSLIHVRGRISDFARLSRNPISPKTTTWAEERIKGECAILRIRIHLRLSSAVSVSYDEIWLPVLTHTLFEFDAFLFLASRIR